MKVLTETHIWLWMLNKPERNSVKTRRIQETPRNEICQSPISIGEVILIARDGRLAKATDPFQWFDRAFAGLPLFDAPIGRDISLEMGRIELRHGDPADRYRAGVELQARDRG